MATDFRRPTTPVTVPQDILEGLLEIWAAIAKLNITDEDEVINTIPDLQGSAFAINDRINGVLDVLNGPDPRLGATIEKISRA